MKHSLPQPFPLDEVGAGGTMIASPREMVVPPPGDDRVRKVVRSMRVSFPASSPRTVTPCARSCAWRAAWCFAWCPAWICVSLCAWLALAAPCTAGNLLVNPGGVGFPDIQSALDAALDGDTVLVAPGEYAIDAPLDFNREGAGPGPDGPDAGDPLAAEPGAGGAAPKNIVLRAVLGPAETVIRMVDGPAAPDRGSVVIFRSGEGPSSVLEGFTLTGGRGTRPIPELGESWGGGVLCVGGSSPTIVNCEIRGNSATRGGGIDCDGASSPLLVGCRIVGNFASELGGGLCARRGSEPVLRECVVAENRAGRSGGGVCSAVCEPRSCGDAAVTLDRSTVAGNWARSGGGVFAGRMCESDAPEAVCSSGSAIVTNSIVWGNSGGAVIAGPSSAVPSPAVPSPVTVRQSCIDDPSWQGSGNVLDDPLFCGWNVAEVHVDPSFPGPRPGPGSGEPDDPFSSLEEALAGYCLDLAPDSPCIGAAEDGGNLGAPTGPCAQRGSASRTVRLAPGSHDLGNLHLRHGVRLVGAGRAQSRLVGDLLGLGSGSSLASLTVKGSVLLSARESPEITDCAIVESRGDGIFCGQGAAPRLAGCVIARNRGSGVSCAAGARPILSACEIRENQGSGVLARGASPTLVNCLVVANSVVYGAGIDLTDASSAILFTTITGNPGGGVRAVGSAPAVTSSILWGNPGGALRLSGGFAQVSHSCLEGQGVWPGAAIVGADPLFVRAGYWVDPATPGKPVDDTWVDGDYHLRPGSPCIDAASQYDTPPNDIEGASRPCGAGVDMGAYESGGCGRSVPFRRGDADAGGEIDISDGIFTLLYLFLGGAAPPCPAAADADDNGEIELTDPVYVIHFLFRGTPPPPEPFASCGEDPTPDGLGCPRFAPCE